MDWLWSRRMRILAGSVWLEFCEQGHDDHQAQLLAAAIAHACYPAATYGDRGAMDARLSQVKRFSLRPCHPRLARRITRLWQNGSLTSDQAFEQIWGFEVKQFAAWFTDRAAS